VLLPQIDYHQEASFKTSRVCASLHSHSPFSILHLFDNACNLIRPDGLVVSLVNETIGPGPFGIVLPSRFPFDRRLRAQDAVRIEGQTIRLGSLTIDISMTPLWHPCPPWRELYLRRGEWLAYLPALLSKRASQLGASLSGMALAEYERSFKVTGHLLRDVLNARADNVVDSARALAGRGQGLTPAGDDYLVGVMYGLWATVSSTEASRLAGLISEAAIPRTTSLSAAWLRVSAEGEAAEPWHTLFDGVLDHDVNGIELAIDRILSIGHSSGADGLTGFLSVIEVLA
jgi:hypothetical protein